MFIINVIFNDIRDGWYWINITVTASFIRLQRIDKFFSKHNITAGFIEFERQKLLIFFIITIFIFLIKGLFMLFALWYQMRFAYGVQKFISKEF